MWSVLFVVGVAVSLAASWLLVARLERLGERFGLSEALLGVVAALAADAPEITSAVTALIHGQSSVGAGVVIGSNVFNLAALLGVAALVAGRIALHRRVVLLGGAVGMWVAAGCLATVLGWLSPLFGLLLVMAVLVPYLVVLGLRRAQLERAWLPQGWRRWLAEAIHEEELELSEAIRPHPGTWRDGLVAVSALVCVVGASSMVERAASAVGGHFAVADMVTGGLVLAVVTSLPNAVAAVYLAARGRGAAVLSTALNSNALNVAAGLLLPGAVLGLGPRSGQATLVAAWYAGLTLACLVLAYRDHGVYRASGLVVIAGYLAFVAALLVSMANGSVSVVTAVVPAGIIAAGCAVLLARPPVHPVRPKDLRQTTPPHVGGERARQGLLTGWSATRLWLLSFSLCFAVAICDAATGRHLILIGVLIVGPCCALLTGRWRRTAATGVCALVLGVVLGMPDGVFATTLQYNLLAMIAATTATASLGAAVLQRRQVL
ncbi:hypothetical protein NGB36_10155 [Streptomyces sp. RB6PN25]|uniref:Sodium/calcium exchanger membrane region domain-containing protein n=1 Tax=Streptomyces humicola TaxID=2953240 RepID=A0ABT1PTF7_9ACTN|nr:hypothetical protein [Streptomyces humicola]MCQ4080952.1 hypothetical protein [Streptomyces humicola]